MAPAQASIYGHTMTVKDIISAALQLPPEVRSEVADLLLESLDAEQPPELSESWVAEINRRIAEVRAGQADSIPWDEALAGARARLASAD